MVAGDAKKVSRKFILLTTILQKPTELSIYIYVKSVNSAVERFSSPEFIHSRDFLQKSVQKVYFNE